MASQKKRVKCKAQNAGLNLVLVGVAGVENLLKLLQREAGFVRTAICTTFI